MSLHLTFNKEYFTGKNYTIYGRKKIQIRAARFTDIPQIVSLLQSIQITPDNLDDKFSYTHKDSFKKRGGFFVILNETQLESLLEDPQNLILIAVSQDRGKEIVNGFLWCRLNLDRISVSNWILDGKEFEEKQINKFNNALDKNLVFTAEECAIEPSYHGNGIAYCLIYEMYNWLWAKGYLFVVLQVYIILGEYLQGSLISKYLPNEASIKHIKKYGAVRIKKASVPEQTVGQRKFKITADVFMLDLEFALAELKKLIANV